MPTNGDGLGVLAVRMGADGTAETPRSVVRDAGKGEIRGLFVTVGSAQALPVCPQDSACAPVELLNEPAVVDVIQLGGEVTIELSSCDLPVGDYTGLRVDILSATLTLADSTEIDLPICDGALPLVMDLPFSIGEDGVTEVTVRLSHDNLLSRDGSGGYLFCPDLGSGGDDDDHGDDGGDDDHGDDDGGDDDHGDDDDHDDHRGWW
jgi:hypothetical protein